MAGFLNAVNVQLHAGSVESLQRLLIDIVRFPTIDDQGGEGVQLQWDGADNSA